MKDEYTGYFYYYFLFIETLTTNLLHNVMWNFVRDLTIMSTDWVWIVSTFKQSPLHVSDALPCKFIICISGHYIPKLFINLLSLLVTWCPNKFNIQQVYAPSTLFCTYLRTISYFWRTIHWLDFITEKKCVYCAVRTRFLKQSAFRL
jgi:hypothetical protein